MPTVRTNGIDLFYEVQGEGAPLLLIAGFACDHAIWSLVVPALAAYRRVIVFDNRGVGQSSGGDCPLSINQMAEDAVALLNAIGVGPVDVAGHSMGGLIAQELAIAHPERARSLLLLSACSQLDERSKAIIDSWGDLPRLVDAVTMTRLILPWMYTSAFFERLGAIEQVITEILNSPFLPGAQGIFHQCRAISDYHYSMGLAELSCPTLVVAGREDILIPLALSEQLARTIRGARLMVLEATGHGMLIESPGAVAKAILDFLSQPDV